MSLKKQKSQEFTRVAECLQRNGNGVYFAVLKVKGKKIRKSLETNDRGLANRRLREFREESKSFGEMDSKGTLFDDLASAWLASIKGATSKPASHRRREVAVNGLLPFFKGLKMRDIGFDEIEQWQNRRGKKISSRSHNIELETLNLIFAYAIKKSVVLKNPASEFKRLRQKDEAVTEKDVPTKQQFSTLMTYLRNSPQSSIPGGATDMIEFFAYSGVRLNEGNEILVRDIDPDRERLTITGGELKTKNHKSRTFPLFPNLKDVVERITSKRENLTPTSKLFTIKDPRGAMSLALKATGLPKFNTHSLRHFFVTNALESNIPSHIIAGWIGHSDGGSLLNKVYCHFRPDFSNEAALKMTFKA